ncbi:MAG: DUF3570 domain-containing protein [Nitrospiria bacterium]
MRLPVKRFLLMTAGVVLLMNLKMETAKAIDPPEDEVFTGYNLYQGGGITVHGPAIIVRKALKEKAAIEAGARVDLVSSASIDVVTQASKYSEERKEYTLGGSRIFGETLVNASYTLSDESDYTSDTYAVGLTQDLLDKNLTLSLRVARSWDKVGQNDDPAFGWKDFKRTIYGAGLTQSFSPRWLVQLNYEISADDGYINNPYRSALSLGGAPLEEHYPDARTGQAVVLRSSYAFLAARPEGPGGVGSTIQIDYRYYRDTFDVRSHTAKLLSQHRVYSNWRMGVFYRYAEQSAASFYGDRLPVNQFFRARDKELSSFSDHWAGVSLKYQPPRRTWGWLQKPYFKAGYSMIIFKYDNFTDPRNGELYSKDAHVFSASFGFNY